MITGSSRLLHIFDRLKNIKFGRPHFAALRSLFSSIVREGRVVVAGLAGRFETGAVARPVFPEVEQFMTEQDAEKQLKLLDKIFDIALGEDEARADLADNLEDFFEAFVVLMRLQDTGTQNRCYTAFYAVSRKMLDKEYGEYSVKGGVAQRTDRFWIMLMTLSRLRKIRAFFRSDILLMPEKGDACGKIRENERNPDVVRIKEIIWSLIHEEVNLLNYGIDKESMPANKSEVWAGEDGGRPDQPLALLWPGRKNIRGRFHNRIYSLRKALKHNGHLPFIVPGMEGGRIREGVNIVFFYERWSGDLILKLKSAIRGGNANIILASAFAKNIVLREEGGVVTARLRSGLLYDKEGRLTLASFSEPLEIHYVYRAFKTPSARNVSGLGVPVAVDYPCGRTYTRKTDISRLLSSCREETGVRIPGFLEFKSGSLRSMKLESFADLLESRFPSALHEELVVKPVVGLGGEGIIFFERHDIEGIFDYAKTLCKVQDIMIEERVRMARINIEGEDFDSSLRFHLVKDAGGNPVIYRGFCRIGRGVVNVSLGARIIGMEDLFRHMTAPRLSEEEIEPLLKRAEQSALKIYDLLGREGDLDYAAVDLYFDGEGLVLNEVNVGNIGGDFEFNTLYPHRRGILSEAVCERLIFRALCYERQVGKLRRWHRAGAHTAGTEVEIDLTTVGAVGHRRPMTYSEARKATERFPFPEQSIYLDTSGGIEAVTGHRNIYDVRGETLIFARQALAVIQYLKNIIGGNGGADDVLISCIGQYGSGVHLNIRRPSYGESPEPGSVAREDYRRIKAVLPIISGLSANPSEGFWHPLSDDLGMRKTTEFFSVRRYGDVVYNSLNRKPFFPPRLEIRPPDTPLHPAYIGLYYALIYAALAGKAPEGLSFEEYHKAFCSGAMENLRGAVLFSGRRMSLRDALNIFYETNREIFEELELSDAQRELLDAARLNGFTYKDFNDSLGSMLNEKAYLGLIMEIFERGCRDPEQKLSDIIKVTMEEKGEELGIQPQQAEAIYALTEFLTYRPVSLSLAVPEVRQDLRLEEVRLGVGQKEAVRLLLDKGFMFKRLIPGNNGESLIVMSKRLDYSGPVYLEAKRLPEPEQVILDLPGALDVRAEKPLLLVLITERGRSGISMRAEATYVGLIEERNRKLGSPFDFQMMDLDQVSDPEVSRELAEKIGRSRGVVFNRLKSGKTPAGISEMLDRHGINSWSFEEAVRNRRSLLDRIRENPELREHVIDAGSLKGMDFLETIEGRPFVIDAVVQKDYSGGFCVVQKIVRIPKGKEEGRVHVGVTPGYAMGQQTVIDELLEDGTISEELVNRMDFVLKRLGLYLEECFNSAGNFGCEILITTDMKIFIKSVTDKPFQAPVGITPIVQGRVEQAMRIADQALWRYLNG